MCGKLPDTHPTSDSRKRAESEIIDSFALSGGVLAVFYEVLLLFPRWYSSSSCSSQVLFLLLLLLPGVIPGSPPVLNAESAESGKTH